MKKISKNIKNYMKAYKAYEKSYNAKLAEANKLAEKFSQEHKVGVIAHVLLLNTAIIAVLGTVCAICVYGIPWIYDKIQGYIYEKKLKKFNSEMSKDIEETVEVSMKDLEKACENGPKHAFEDLHVFEDLWGDVLHKTEKKGEEKNENIN